MDTLLVYGNYSCLHCRRAYAALADVAADSGDGLVVEYRHFARAADFPDAERAAEAAAAARAQGRFGEMHELLFSGQPFFDERALVAHAARIGLDVERFTRELRSGTYRDEVRADHAAGDAAGVTGTPAFFFKGERVADSWDLDGLRALVGDAGARK